MRSCTSPAGVARSRSPLPLRCPRRSAVRWWRSASSAAAASASIRACRPWRTSSEISSPVVPLSSSCVSSVAAESEMGMVWSREGGTAPTRVRDQPTHSPAGALSNGPSAPATPVLSPGNYTTARDAPLSPQCSDGGEAPSASGDQP